MSPHPVKIQRLGGVALSITWSDGLLSSLPSEVLRKQCPCAQCREDRGEGAGHAKPLTGGTSVKKRSMLTVIEATKEEEIKLKNVWGIGNYAIGLEWGDGHNSGIYTYEHLRALSDAVNTAV